MASATDVRSSKNFVQWPGGLGTTPPTTLGSHPQAADAPPPPAHRSPPPLLTALAIEATLLPNEIPAPLARLPVCYRDFIACNLEQPERLDVRLARRGHGHGRLKLCATACAGPTADCGV